MSALPPTRLVDLLVVGAGPTGIALGVEAARARLSVLVMDRGPLLNHLLEFPTFLRFFTTRERLEIGGLPFSVPEDKPDRRQAIAYYHGVVSHYGLPLALHEEVLRVEREDGEFAVHTLAGDEALRRRARAVALASGYFGNPQRLGVPGEDLPWVHSRYREAFRHFAEDVVVVGGGNSAVEAALELWRAGARVTLVHRGQAVRSSIKYWLKPDFENRIAESSINALFGSQVVEFGDPGVRVASEQGERVLPAHAAYVLIGYQPDADLQRRCGVRVDPRSLVPTFHPETCESNVPGLYLAGTLQAGRETDRIFIDNSRDHGLRIVRHLSQRLAGKA